jgi:hypothetical protein
MRFGQQRSLSPRPNEHGALRWLSFYDHPFSQPRVILRARVAARQQFLQHYRHFRPTQNIGWLSDRVQARARLKHSYFYGGGSNLGNFRNFID